MKRRGTKMTGEARRQFKFNGEEYVGCWFRGTGSAYLFFIEAVDPEKGLLKTTQPAAVPQRDGTWKYEMRQRIESTDVLKGAFPISEAEAKAFEKHDYFPSLLGKNGTLVLGGAKHRGVVSYFDGNLMVLNPHYQGGERPIKKDLVINTGGQGWEWIPDRRQSRGKKNTNTQQ